jgi:hypothetical protein
MTMLWPCDPTDTVGSVILDPFLCLVWRQETETIVIDEETRCATVTCVGLHGSFERNKGRLPRRELESKG